jgi:hypothetical protein
MKVTRQFWAGVLVGVGLGLMLGAALVELNLLAPDHKAWASLVGAVIGLVGAVLARNPAPGPT